MAQADAGLAAAQARLAELKSGARSAEIDAAQAAVDAAQAQVARLEAGAKPEDIDAAQAAVDAAQANLQRVRDGAAEQQVIAAKSDLANVEAALRQAQAAYDKIAGNPDAGSYPQALQLEQATNAFNAAKARSTTWSKAARRPRSPPPRPRYAVLKLSSTAPKPRPGLRTWPPPRPMCVAPRPSSTC